MRITVVETDTKVGEIQYTRNNQDIIYLADPKYVFIAGVESPNNTSLAVKVDDIPDLIKALQKTLELLVESEGVQP